MFRQVRNQCESDESLVQAVSRMMQKADDPYTIVSQMMMNFDLKGNQTSKEKDNDRDYSGDEPGDWPNLSFRPTAPKYRR